MATKPRSDPGYSCGSKDNEGRCAVCPPGCHGRKAYEESLPRFGSLPPAALLCPECRDGKCRNCIEQAMTDDDELVPCGCRNHAKGGGDAFENCDDCGGWPTHAPGCPQRQDHTEGNEA